MMGMMTICPECDGYGLMHGYDADCPNCGATGKVKLHIAAEVVETAERTLDLMLCNVPEAGDVRQASIMDIAVALMAERTRAANLVLQSNEGSNKWREVAAAILGHGAQQ